MPYPPIPEHLNPGFRSIYEADRTKRFLEEAETVLYIPPELIDLLQNRIRVLRAEAEAFFIKNIRKPFVNPKGHGVNSHE